MKTYPIQEITERLREMECELRKKADALHGIGALFEASACASRADLVDQIICSVVLPAANKHDLK